MEPSLACDHSSVWIRHRGGWRAFGFQRSEEEGEGAIVIPPRTSEPSEFLAFIGNREAVRSSPPKALPLRDGSRDHQKKTPLYTKSEFGFEL